MTNSPKSGGAREFWVSEEVENQGKYIYQKALPHSWPPWCPQIHTIEYSVYDALKQQALAMREALEEIYNDTKAEHGIHESEIKSWDSSSLGNVKGALEQFDEFMKRGEK